MPKQTPKQECHNVPKQVPKQECKNGRLSSVFSCLLFMSTIFSVPRQECKKVRNEGRRLVSGLASNVLMLTSPLRLIITDREIDISNLTPP